MARRAEQARSNGFDSDVVHAFVGEIERHLGELESERGVYMQRCQAIRKAISDVYGDAKTKGIPTRPLKDVVKTRELQKRVQKLRDEMERDQAETYDMLLDVLGDFGGTPLGQAALAKKAGEQTEAPKRGPGRPRKETTEKPQGEPQGDVEQFAEHLGRPKDGADETADEAEAFH